MGVNLACLRSPPGSFSRLERRTASQQLGPIRNYV